MEFFRRLIELFHKPVPATAAPGTPGGAPAVVPTPETPAPATAFSWARFALFCIVTITTLGAYTYAVYEAVKNNTPIPQPPIIVPFNKEQHPEEPPEPRAFGWHGDKEAIATAVAKNKPTAFGTTPAGRLVLATTEDVYLWRNVRKASGRNPTDKWYPNIDQGPVGCCVGAGWKHATDVCQANGVLLHGGFEWKPTSAEVIYAGSRVQIGRGQIDGDGSIGAWADEFQRTYGMVPMEKFDEKTDLSAFSPARARAWGNTGVPTALQTVAKTYPVKSTALVKTWAEADKAISQGYPIAVCSSQGFTMTRGADGFARASGSWAHCMAIIGVRRGARPGGFILNSWGDRAHTGPVFPADAPVAGFWADATVIGRMLAEGDSYALSDVAGFPGREDFFVEANRAPNADLFAITPFRQLLNPGRGLENPCAFLKP